MKIISTSIALIMFASSVLAGEAPASETSIGRPHNCTNYYPEKAREENLSGTTKLHFTIGTDGYTSDISVEESSGHDVLDAAALKCARVWKYKPALLHNEPIAVPWTASIVWKAEELSDVCKRFYHGPQVDFSGIDGVTEVTTIAKWGKVTTVFVTHSSGNEDLDEAAVGCTKTLRFPRNNPEQRGSTKLNWKAILTPSE